MNPIAALRRHFANVERSRQLLEEIRDGIANLTDVSNRKQEQIGEGIANLADLTNRKQEKAIAVSAAAADDAKHARQTLKEVREGLVNLTDVTNRHLLKVIRTLEAADKPKAPQELERT